MDKSKQFGKKVATFLIKYYRDLGYNDEINTMTFDAIEVSSDEFVNSTFNVNVYDLNGINSEIVYAFLALSVMPRSFYNKMDEILDIVYDGITKALSSVEIESLYTYDDIVNLFDTHIPSECPELLDKLNIINKN